MIHLMHGLRRPTICCSRLLLLLLWVHGSPAVAQTSDAPADGLVDSLEQAAVRALNFAQGDRSSLTEARDDFTETAWSRFMVELKDWLDGDGAPNFSSAFTPSGPALDVGLMGEFVRLTIPGVLEHRSRNASGRTSATSYRAEVEIEAVASSRKIQHLRQRTCGGASTVASCR